MTAEASFLEENKERVERLKKKITEAFGAVKQPAGDNIALHECEECRAVRKDFRNVDWRRADAALLENNYDKIPLFSPAAFRYFLPAYLLYALNNFDDGLSDVCEFTLYSLTPDKDWKDESGQISLYWVDKFAAFTADQMDCVYEFLELAKQNPIYIYQTTSIERAFGRLKAIRPAISAA